MTQEAAAKELDDWHQVLATQDEQRNLMLATQARRAAEAGPFIEQRSETLASTPFQAPHQDEDPPIALDDPSPSCCLDPAQSNNPGSDYLGSVAVAGSLGAETLTQVSIDGEPDQSYAQYDSDGLVAGTYYLVTEGNPLVWNCYDSPLDPKNLIGSSPCLIGTYTGSGGVVVSDQLADTYTVNGVSVTRTSVCEWSGASVVLSFVNDPVNGFYWQAVITGAGVSDTYESDGPQGSPAGTYTDSAGNNITVS